MLTYDVNYKKKTMYLISVKNRHQYKFGISLYSVSGEDEIAMLLELFLFSVQFAK